MRFALFILFLCYTNSFAASLKINLKQDLVTVLPGQTYLFLGHPTNYWDDKEITRKPIEHLLRLATTHGIPTIASVHSEGFTEPDISKSYFVSNKNVDFLLHSDGGAHALQFPNAKTIIVGGGSLSVCLCEGIRDIVAGFGEINGAKDIILVNESLYDSMVLLPKQILSGPPQDDVTLAEFVNEYYLPNFPCKVQITMGHGPVKNLENVNVEVFSKNELLVKTTKPNAKGLLRIHFLPMTELPAYFGKELL